MTNTIYFHKIIIVERLKRSPLFLDWFHDYSPPRFFKQLSQTLTEISSSLKLCQLVYFLIQNLSATDFRLGETTDFVLAVVKLPLFSQTKSQFFDYQIRIELLKIIRFLIFLFPSSMCSITLLHYLLLSYGATLNRFDRILFSCLMQYEKQGTPLGAAGFLWGKKRAELTNARNGWALIDQIIQEEPGQLISYHMMTRTTSHLSSNHVFESSLDLKEEAENEELDEIQENHASRIYNPSFILFFLTQCFQNLKIQKDFASKFFLIPFLISCNSIVQDGHKFSMFQIIAKHLLANIEEHCALGKFEKLLKLFKRADIGLEQTTPTLRVSISSSFSILFSELVTVFSQFTFSIFSPRTFN